MEVRWKSMEEHWKGVEERWKSVEEKRARACRCEAGQATAVCCILPPFGCGLVLQGTAGG